MRTLVRLTALAALLAVGCAPAAAASPPAWRPCGDDGAVQCTSVSVPVDHADPGGPRIDIAVTRLPVADPGARRGTLVVHVGGPAPSRPLLLDPARRADVAELNRWFDVVTFDSRGYGASAALCDPALAPTASVVDSPESYHRAAAATAAYGESCRADHPGLSGHVTSADVAEDVEAIRVALGEDRISFFGNSYGTAFGREYAARHGERLDRLYLDSVLDLSATYLESARDTGLTREAGLARFAELCAADPGCALAGEDVPAVVDEVLAAADRAPIPAGDGAPVSGTLIRVLLSSSAFPPLVPTYADALDRARRGDGSGFAALLGMVPPGDAGQLTDCAERPVRPDDPAALAAAGERLRAEAPRIGWIAPLSGAWRCAGWPLPAREPGPLDAPDAPPALLVGGTLDAATHPAGMRRVAATLPGSAVLTVDGLRHALYLSGNPCVREAVHSYLLDGTLPAPGAQCPP